MRMWWIMCMAWWVFFSCLFFGSVSQVFMNILWISPKKCVFRLGLFSVVCWAVLSLLGIGIVWIDFLILLRQSDQMVFNSHFINMMNYVDWFLNVNPTMENKFFTAHQLTIFFFSAPSFSSFLPFFLFLISLLCLLRLSLQLYGFLHLSGIFSFSFRYLN